MHDDAGARGSFQEEDDELFPDDDDDDGDGDEDGDGLAQLLSRSKRATIGYDD